jgi:hypothetical protein
MTADSSEAMRKSAMNIKMIRQYEQRRTAQGNSGMFIAFEYGQTQR